MSLPLKASCNEQHAVIRFFLWAKRLIANGIYSQMHQTIYVWCQNFSRGRQSIVDGLSIAAVDSFSEFGWYVEKWNVNLDV